jgi:hypothetical protein
MHLELIDLQGKFCFCLLISEEQSRSVYRQHAPATDACGLCEMLITERQASLLLATCRMSAGYEVDRIIVSIRRSTSSFNWDSQSKSCT